MTIIIYLLSFSAISYIYMKNVMHMFQQNRYEFYRYTKWLIKKRPNYFLSVVYIALMVALAFIKKLYVAHILTIVLTLLFAIILIQKEAKEKYIKPLVLTARVKRTFVLYYIFLILLEIVFVRLLKNQISLVGILMVIAPYLLIYPTALVLKPLEWSIKKWYENDAKAILKENRDLKIIGITGSYGKTTTKNIVGEILSDSYYTLITPASYNTPMGITRTIRENLKNIHEVFVCEMGADHVGDIAYLMDMVEPQFGIVSSIGPQHLNTFGSLRNIIREKMLEIEMLPENGVGIINLDNEYIANYPIKNVCKVISVGAENEKADLFARNVTYSKEGSSFDVTINDNEYHFVCRLLGKHNVTNVLCGIALALEMGIEIADIQKAVENLKQVEHRLELKKINGFTFIDDAFNSNPAGSASALETLSIMDGKRVIVTPGMIDLGEEENRINYDFGKKMIGNCDLIILVGKNQTKYIYKGLNDFGYDMEKVIVVDKVKEAFDYIYTNLSAADTILLENDLPDAFNK